VLLESLGTAEPPVTHITFVQGSGVELLIEGLLTRITSHTRIMERELANWDVAAMLVTIEISVTTLTVFGHFRSTPKLATFPANTAVVMASGMSDSSVGTELAASDVTTTSKQHY